MGIDGLTDDLLIKILTFMSLKESGKTSVLARRWRNLWGFSNKILRFDYTDNSSRLDFTINRKFQSMVRQVLDHQQTRDIDAVIISNYDVDAERFTPRSSPAVDSWMEFLMHKEVERLELYLTPDSHYTFPNYAASNLKTLRLAHVDVKDSTVQYFLSCCPNLEELSILSSFRTKKIRVSCPPKLKVFEVSRCLHMEGVVITNATDLGSLTYEGEKDSLKLTNIPNLRHLTLSGDFGLLFVFEPKEEWSYSAQLEKLVLDFQFLDTEISSLDASRVPKLCSLKRLELQLYKIQHGSLLFITSLIEASPQLRELKIELSYPLSPSKLNKGKSWFPDIKEAKGVNKFVHAKLKVVEMVGFVGCSSEKDLLMQLYKICPNMEKVVINTESDYYDHPLPGRALPHFSACDGCLPEIGATERGEARRRAKKVSKSMRKIEFIVI